MLNPPHPPPLPLNPLFDHPGGSMSAYVQSPLGYAYGRPLGAAIVKTLTDADGRVSVVGYYNHAANGWDVEFDRAKHLQPFSVLPPVPAKAGHRHQAWSPPRLALTDPSVMGLVYAIDADGEPADVIETVPWAVLSVYSNLN